MLYKIQILKFILQVHGECMSTSEVMVVHFGRERRDLSTWEGSLSTVKNSAWLACAKRLMRDRGRLQHKLHRDA